MGAFKDTYDIIKDLCTLVDEYENAEMSSKLLEVQRAFFDFREEFEDLKDENKTLKETIKQLVDNSELEKDLELTPNGYYIRKSDESNIKYCAACWKNHHKLMPFSTSIGRSIACTNCQHTIQIK